MDVDPEAQCESLKDTLLSSPNVEAKSDDHSLLSAAATASTEDGTNESEALGPDVDWSSTHSAGGAAQGRAEQDRGGVELGGRVTSSDPGEPASATACEEETADSAETQPASFVAEQMGLPQPGAPLPADVSQADGEMLAEEEVVKLINWLLCNFLGHSAFVETAWVTDYMALLSVADGGSAVAWLQKHLAQRPAVVVYVVTCLAETQGQQGGFGHWVCFAVRNPEINSPVVVEVYDSQNHPDWYWDELNMKARLVAQAAFKLRAGPEATCPSISLRLVDVKYEEMQRGGTDCGLHVALFVLGRVLLQQQANGQSQVGPIPNTPASVRAFRSILQELPAYSGPSSSSSSSSAARNGVAETGRLMDIGAFQERLAQAVARSSGGHHNNSGYRHMERPLLHDEEAGLCCACCGDGQDGAEGCSGGW
eukprot:CAMPEP_0178378090 /NCGR_PEP_ID=MMETSP0689_2-20121128/4249_1 /TAXON_ID=160604 /ORGANISM="Amphidinium massartii, Strain CS-259" /LENGTH=423 /DNA_ID=CAMNT_0019998153 /DNA_START=41 /DNA_END=1309 /DNA_ORIENTATION=-